MSTEKRQFERYYLTDRDTNIAMQAAGMPAKILMRGFFNWKTLGPCIIKDVSLGGAGLLSPMLLSPTKKYALETAQGEVIPFIIAHEKAVNKKLNFYGVSWENSSSNHVKKLIANAQSRLK
ncbi:hypothetical protein [Paraferrimonas sp. SM1919]|uniref:hypothetical protein n=1 Tax=Paraferrimonas sp. SM1919 TaxID=2662263 RepID=UPI0013D79E2B|nr:hypothetical protein [Paraferrimonas sp. SM1919]